MLTRAKLQTQPLQAFTKQFRVQARSRPEEFPYCGFGGASHTCGEG